MTDPLEIFPIAVSGLEPILADEVRAAGFTVFAIISGGVTAKWDWSAVWRANLVLRGASGVPVRIGGFLVFHLARLEKRSRKFPWADTLRADVPLRVEVTRQKSRIYHQGAAKQRIETAIRDSLGAEIRDDAALTVKARIDKNACTFNIETSEEGFHKRGFKSAMGKAPMRETTAALFFRAAGYDGAEPMVDPMCGPVTFVIEAAEMALGLASGRARHFAFEDLASFDAAAWKALKSHVTPGRQSIGFLDPIETPVPSPTARGTRSGRRVRDHPIHPSRGQRSETTRRTSRPYDRQPALWWADRKQPASLRAPRGFGTDVSRRIPRPACRFGDRRSEIGACHRASLETGRRPVAHGGLKVKLYQTALL